MAIISQSSQQLPSKLAPFTSVATATIRPLKAITSAELASLREGDVVYVTSVRDYWKWLPVSAIANDDITICAPTVVGVGLGRFERLLLSSPDWMLQVRWMVDALNSTALANDENDGLTATTPLLTTAERRRRMGKNTWLASTAYHLHYLSNAPGDVLEGDCALNASVYLHGSSTERVGVSPALYTGTITALDTFNAATNVPWALTSAGIPVSWTASGLIGKRIRLTSGANINALAYATLDQTAKKARVTEFLTPVASFSVAPFVAPANASNGPSNGDTFVVENVVTLSFLQINLTGTPGNNPGGTRVIIDSLATNLSGGSALAVFSDGCNISTVRGFAPIFHIWHNDLIGGNFGVFDEGQKIIAGGMAPSGFSSFLRLSNLSSVLSTFDFFTIQGNNRFTFTGTDTEVSPVGWSFGRIGVFDSSQPNLCLAGQGHRLILGGGGGALTFVLYGSGNTSDLVILMPNTVADISAGSLTQTVVTASATQVQFYNARTQARALNPATGVFTALRNLSFANIQATVAAGGFESTFVDPITGCGFNRIA